MELLAPLEEKGLLQLPQVPEGCVHNGHMFYIKVKDIEERSLLIRYLDQQGVNAVFHYIPLHTAPAGKRFGRFHGEGAVVFVKDLRDAFEAVAVVAGVGFACTVEAVCAGT